MLKPGITGTRNSRERYEISIPKLGRHLWINKAVLALCFPVVLSCLGQGTIRVTFDGEPNVPHGGSSVRSGYIEYHGDTGVVFTNFNLGAFLRFGGFAGFPQNGTVYLRPGATYITFYLSDSSLFGIASVDLAGSSNVDTNFTTAFVGYRPDGSTVSTSFSGSGIDFQTFQFGPEFRDLTRVELPWSGYWSLDNLVVQIPEPSSFLLFSLGGLVLAASHTRTRAKQ